MTIVDPVTETVHVPPAVVGVHVGVPAIVTFAGTVSVTVSEPVAVPTFFTTTLYTIVAPGETGLPLPGVSDFVTVNFGRTTGFVTVDEQYGDVHWPVVIVAVLTTVDVSVGLTVAS